MLAMQKPSLCAQAGIAPTPSLPMSLVSMPCGPSACQLQLPRLKPLLLPCVPCISAFRSMQTESWCNAAFPVKGFSSQVYLLRNTVLDFKLHPRHAWSYTYLQAWPSTTKCRTPRTRPGHVSTPICFEHRGPLLKKAHRSRVAKVCQGVAACQGNQSSDMALLESRFHPASKTGFGALGSQALSCTRPAEDPESHMMRFLHPTSTSCFRISRAWLWFKSPCMALHKKVQLRVSPGSGLFGSVRAAKCLERPVQEQFQHMPCWTPFFQSILPAAAPRAPA